MLINKLLPSITKSISNDLSNYRDYIERGMDKQMESVKLGETKVDTVHFYGELFQFFLGEFIWCLFDKVVDVI